MPLAVGVNDNAITLQHNAEGGPICSGFCWGAWQAMPPPLRLPLPK